MEEVDQFCQWSASSNKECNIYATLNHNLQKYEHQQKNTIKVPKPFRINKFTIKEKPLLSHRTI